MVSFSNPRRIIAEVALEYVGVKETSRNQGPDLQQFWDATRYPDGQKNREPWCSACASFWVQEADRRSYRLHFPKPPRFSAVRDWEPWARKAEIGAEIFKPRNSSGRVPMGGDIVIFLPHLSHIGIVIDFDGRNVWTVEGNTGPDGGRDGDGVYTKKRAYDFCGSFIRLPALAIR